jgi:preprotein translocase subunit SecG
MQTVLIVIHLMIVLALVGVVLLQRSEGGGLGMGGGSGFMSARGAANALTRTTAILAACFFATSLLLSILARYSEKPTDILDRVPSVTQNDGNGAAGKTPDGKAPDGKAPADGKGILDQLGGTGEPNPAAGTATAPVTPATPAPEKATAPSMPEANGVQVPKTP